MAPCYRSAAPPLAGLGHGAGGQLLWARGFLKVAGITRRRRRVPPAERGRGAPVKLPRSRRLSKLAEIGKMGTGDGFFRVGGNLWERWC
jgi:hypothetical protein